MNTQILPKLEQFLGREFSVCPVFDGELTLSYWFEVGGAQLQKGGVTNSTSVHSSVFKQFSDI